MILTLERWQPAAIFVLHAFLLPLVLAVNYETPEFGSERVVFQTNFGDVEFGFFPEVAPKTVAHMAKLCRLGTFIDNHFFRVDRGFVAQVADVVGGRRARMNREQDEEAQKTIPGEFTPVKHVRGILSMGRYDNPDSATSSFSILLGNAKHLDNQYAVFGKVTNGWQTLTALEAVETRQEGIFVMPLERITIFSTYVYDTKVPSQVSDGVSDCETERTRLQWRLSKLEVTLEEVRRKCLPG
eukprot:TRINITY_DN6367_c0_g6_i1.p1 TRINITY_DN6367_c0_g6~~TRINITY_DN6367_c0_g6_i1.p1  ORF type:complete len:241 (-),score=42.17 TRINITY_DN6367_c0_g6_i1:238-960(-)